MVIYASEPELIWFNYYRTRTGFSTQIGANIDGKEIRMKVDPDTAYRGVTYLLETGLDEEIVLPSPAPVEPEPTPEPLPTKPPFNGGPIVGDPDPETPATTIQRIIISGQNLRVEGIDHA